MLNMDENRKYDRKDAWRYYINEKMMKEVMRKCGLMFVLGLSLQYIFSFILEIYFLFNSKMGADYSEAMSVITGTKITLVMFIFIGILTPIMEEVAYRGLVLTICNLFLPFFVGNIIQAAIFAYSHGNIVQCAYAFLLGLLIGGLIKITGSFFYGIFLHMGINIFGLYIDKYIPEGTSIWLKVIYLFVSVFVGAGCLYFLVKFKMDKQAKA